VNVLASYACRDHREIVRERDVQARLPIDLSGERLHGVHGNIPRTTVLRRLLQWSGVSALTFSLRKEVIQPQVLLRLPCYDFTPIMSYTLDGCLPCGSAHRLLVQPTFVM
jgi:hypothetical protein